MSLAIDQKLEISILDKICFKARNGFSKIFIPIIVVKMKLRATTKKFTVDSAVQFPTKSILRPTVLTETTRQRGS